MLTFARTGEILKSVLSSYPPLELKPTDAVGAATSILAEGACTLIDYLKPAEPSALKPAPLL